VKADQEERRKKKEEELSSRISWMGLRPQKTMAIFWEKIHGAWGPLKPRLILLLNVHRNP